MCVCVCVHHAHLCLAVVLGCLACWHAEKWHSSHPICQWQQRQRDKHAQIEKGNYHTVPYGHTNHNCRHMHNHKCMRRKHSHIWIGHIDHITHTFIANVYVCVCVCVCLTCVFTITNYLANLCFRICLFVYTLNVNLQSYSQLNETTQQQWNHYRSFILRVYSLNR